ncbi:zinc finger BED domain-containing protein RICESLEEPER 2-like [Mercurialis annua]|uniref:zinc finger BED domain-containing protein RICESLEEPER 2-like n=1 Tax=Mercurialis annua TaxID=3986 RepID=UPI0024ACB86F|nr:zinc finger BED domain-containing protein RICESLEEPER 2-like [Mercurialis annua]
MLGSEQEQVAAAGDDRVDGSPPELPLSSQQQQHVGAAEGSSQPSQQQQDDANVAGTGGNVVDKKRKQIAVRSKVWDHFERINDESGKLVMAKCLYCAKIYNCDTKVNSTSTLRSHNLACLKNPHSKETRQALLTLQPAAKFDAENEGKGQLGTWKFSQDDILAYMLIVDELPFRFVEGLGFKRFMSYACPRFYIPSRWTANRDCYQLYLDERIISLVPVCGHKGDYIRKILENCLLAWGLKNVFTVTMDNAGNNNTAIAAFKKKMVAWGTDVCRGDYLHMRNSPSRLKKFKDLAADAKLGTKKSLCLDVPTRWNSTYLMLDTACLFQSIFGSYEECDESFRSDMIESIPDFVDWETVKKFATCLSYFYVTTLRISGCLYVTSNMQFQEICDLSIMLDGMLSSDDIEIRQMGRKMRDKFNKYWGDPQKMNLLIFFAHVFDPTSKMKHLLFALSSLFGSDQGKVLFETVNCKLTSLFDEYEKAYVNGGASAYISLSQSIEVVSAQVPIMPSPAKKHLSLMKAKFNEHNKESSVSGTRKSELELYLSETTVDSEKEFLILKCTSGRVLDCFRSSLTPRLVEALVCTQDWLRTESSPLMIEECLDELEPFEQELPN